MSRKTAVCLLFVLLLTVAGSISPVHARSWSGGDAVVTPADTPRSVALPHGQDADPDGLQAPAPAFTTSVLQDLLRLLLGLLIP